MCINSDNRLQNIHPGYLLIRSRSQLRSVLDGDRNKRLLKRSDERLSERAIIVIDARLFELVQLFLGALNAHLQRLTLLHLQFHVLAKLLDHHVLLLQLLFEQGDFSNQQLSLVHFLFKLDFSGF